MASGWTARALEADGVGRAGGVGGGGGIMAAGHSAPIDILTLPASRATIAVCLPRFPLAFPPFARWMRDANQARCHESGAERRRAH